MEPIPRKYLNAKEAKRGALREVELAACVPAGRVVHLQRLPVTQVEPNPR